MAWKNNTKSKYRSKKVEFNGIVYDSKKEMKRHCELLQLEKAGAITDLQRQVKFILIPTQREPSTIGKRGGVKKGAVIERDCTYIADFVYTTADGLKVVEDVKGYKTPEYKIKRKLMLYIYKIKIKET